jgi:hypothetical protein
MSPEEIISIFMGGNGMVLNDEIIVMNGAEFSKLRKAFERDNEAGFAKIMRNRAIRLIKIDQGGDALYKVRRPDSLDDVLEDVALAKLDLSDNVVKCELRTRANVRAIEDLFEYCDDVVLRQSKVLEAADECIRGIEKRQRDRDVREVSLGYQYRGDVPPPPETFRPR